MNNPLVLVDAHRGASAWFPENTLVAFEAAIASGADSVELDVQLSADGVAVVIHDDTVDRTTLGSGAVAQLTAAELAALDAGSWPRDLDDLCRWMNPDPTRVRAILAADIRYLDDLDRRIAAGDPDLAGWEPADGQPATPSPKGA